MNIEKLKKNIEGETNPVLVATELGFFTSYAIKNGAISLYEGMLLKDLELSLLRQGYMKPGLTYSVSWTYILSLQMLYVMALYFQEKNLALSYVSWMSDAQSFLKENRDHYCKNVTAHLVAGEVSSALTLLSKKRINSKPFDNGPYPNEVFPYDYFSPENEVLENKFAEGKILTDPIATLIAEISLECG